MGGRSLVLQDGGRLTGKCSIRRIKDLAPASSRSCPGIGCGTVGVEAGRVGAVLYRGGGVGEAGKALKTKGIVQGGARPTVRKHGMDRHEDPAPTRSQPRLLDQVRGVIRRLHYSIRTEQAYVDWIRRFILFHRKRHPKEMGAPEVEAFLTDLAVQGKVAASTQNQALNAIVFLYRQVLKKDFGWLEGVERAKKPARLPVVFTREEARAVLARLDGSDG